MSENICISSILMLIVKVVNCSVVQNSQMVLGNIERAQEIIKIMNINGHDSEDSENTALIRASAAGKNLC